MPQLGHGDGTRPVLVPKVIEALVGKKVIGVAASNNHTAVRTEAGSSSPLGKENMGGWATEGKRMSLCQGWSKLSTSL